MGRIQVTDYETVEKTVEKYECDNCQAVVDEEDINTALMATGDQSDGISGSSADETRYLCEECTGLQTALSVREAKEYLKACWAGIMETGVKGVNVLLPLFAASFTAFALFLGGFLENENPAHTGYVVAEAVTGVFGGVIAFIVGLLLLALLIE